jgi:hypothetical protein
MELLDEGLLQAKKAYDEKIRELESNKFIREVMPYYKAEVMRLHHITSDEEYNRRVIEGDMSIYLPQPNGGRSGIGTLDIMSESFIVALFFPVIFAVIF